jgi:hypothetical protein
MQYGFHLCKRIQLRVLLAIQMTDSRKRIYL